VLVQLLGQVEGLLKAAFLTRALKPLLQLCRGGSSRMVVFVLLRHGTSHT
jgi:hypothetical protein